MRIQEATLSKIQNTSKDILRAQPNAFAAHFMMHMQMTCHIREIMVSPTRTFSSFKSFQQAVYRTVCENPFASLCAKRQGTLSAGGIAPYDKYQFSKSSSSDHLASRTRRRSNPL